MTQLLIEYKPIPRIVSYGSVSSTACGPNGIYFSYSTYTMDENGKITWTKRTPSLNEQIAKNYPK